MLVVVYRRKTGNHGMSRDNQIRTSLFDSGLRFGFSLTAIMQTLLTGFTDGPCAAAQ
jgi:hypothetical protein